MYVLMEQPSILIERLRLAQERDILKKAAAYFAQEIVWSTPGLLNTLLVDF